MAAKRNFARCLTRVRSLLRFEPLTVGVNQADEAGLHIENALCQTRNSVESFFRR